MTSWIIVIFGLVASWNYTDFESESAIFDTVCPVFVFIFLVATLIKFVLLIGPDSGRSGHDGGSGSFGGFGGGGDGGCGGDGGGC